MRTHLFPLLCQTMRVNYWRIRSAKALRAVLASVHLCFFARCATADLALMPQIEFVAQTYPANAEICHAQPYSVKVCRKEKNIAVEIHRCMSLAESVRFETSMLKIYAAELAAAFETTRPHVRYNLTLFGTAAKDMQCMDTCCADTALRLLCLFKGVARLRIRKVHISNTAHCEDTETFPSAFFCSLSASPLLAVEEACIEEVGSYFFRGLVRMLTIAPFVRDIEASHLTVCSVRNVDFAAAPPERLWVVSSLYFTNIETLRLGETVEAQQFSKRPRRRQGKKRNIWVYRVLEIKGCSTALAIPHTFLTVTMQALTGSIQVQRLLITVKAQITYSRQAAETYMALAHAHEGVVKVEGKWISVMVGPWLSSMSQTAYSTFFKKFLEQGMDKKIANAPALALSPALTVAIQNTCSVRPFMYVQSMDPHGARKTTWAVEIASVLLETPQGIACVADLFSSHTSKSYAEHALAVLQSLLPGEENSALLARVPKPWPAKMTLLPCGCFKEDAWNAAWHKEALVGKLVQEAYAVHAATHRAHYPNITFLCDKRTKKVVMYFSFVLYWQQEPRPKEEVWRASHLGYTAIVENANLHIEVVPNALNPRSPAYIHILRQIAWHFGDIVKAEAERNGIVQFKQIFIGKATRVMSPFYMCLVMHFLHALIVAQIHPERLNIMYAVPQKASQMALSPYHRAQIAALKKARAGGMRVCTEAFHLTATTPDDILWAGELVAVGTPEDPGVFSVSLAQETTVHIRMGSSGVLEVGVPAIEHAMAKTGWHLAGLSVDALHCMVFHPPLGSCLRSSVSFCLFPYTAQVFILSGSPVFVSSEDVEDYFQRRPKTKKLQRGNTHSWYIYTPTDMVHVRDAAISSGSADSTERIQEYIETVVDVAPHCTGMCFYVADLQKTLQSVARVHAFQPARGGARWAQITPESFCVVLCQSKDPTMRLQQCIQDSQKCIVKVRGVASLQYMQLDVSTDLFFNELLAKKVHEVLESIFEPHGLRYAPMMHREGEGLSFTICNICMSMHPPPPNKDPDNPFGKERAQAPVVFDLSFVFCGHSFHTECLDRSTAQNMDGLGQGVVCPICCTVMHDPQGTGWVGRIEKKNSRARQGVVKKFDPLVVVPELKAAGLNSKASSVFWQALVCSGEAPSSSQ